MKEILTMGADIGSTASKVVILGDDGTILGKALIPVGAGTSGPRRAVAEALAACGKSLEDMGHICATGYGRNSMAEAQMEKSELSCHARGAAFFFPEARTVVDIGGQDAKVLQLAPGGSLLNFVMNDKCAAGTGRFLDVMARALEVDVGDLAGLGAQSRREVSISSTCTVFAESEVISHLANMADRRDIIAGIHRSVAHRVAGLVRRVGVVPRVIMTGGVARNAGVLKALEEAIGAPIATSPLAQFAGAVGAALFALDRLRTES
jgi:predicted CoA-substrate-specific enzyme activase